MKLEMRAHGVRLTHSLKRYIDRRLRFALTRYGDALRKVHVLVSDVNGPRGGNDIHCKVRVVLANEGDVLIEELHDDPFGAVSRATERVSYQVARRLDRLHARRRGRNQRPHARRPHHNLSLVGRAPDGQPDRVA